jgi:hypothetical protein
VLGALAGLVRPRQLHYAGQNGFGGAAGSSAPPHPNSLRASFARLDPASGKNEKCGTLRQHFLPLAQSRVHLGTLVIQQSGVGGLDHREKLVGIA